MQIPETLYSLVDHGILESVVRPLMSGKEAQVYLVVSGGEQRVAKIYKEAQNRTFQKRAEYTEGRKVRNSRDQRAMSRGSRHGRAQNEAAWRSTEVDMIYKLRDAGVRVPTPHHFIDGVLIMELVRDDEGYPAPRIGDLTWSAEDAEAIFQQLLAEVVRMLCGGVVHGDLSEFNVLMGANGPVVIDFPQAVDASTNQNARKLLIRDVSNLHRFAAKFAPEHAALPYAEEMWELYKRNALTPDVRLTGRYRAAQKPSDTAAVMGLIQDAARDERRRRENLGLSMRGAPGTQRDRSPDAHDVRGQSPSQRPAQQAQRDRQQGPRGDGRNVQRLHGTSHDARSAAPRAARPAQSAGYERGPHAAPRAERTRDVQAAPHAERRDDRSRPNNQTFGARSPREALARGNDSRDAPREAMQRPRESSGAERTSEGAQRTQRGHEVARPRQHEGSAREPSANGYQGASDRNPRERAPGAQRMNEPPRERGGQRQGESFSRDRGQSAPRSGESLSRESFSRDRGQSAQRSGESFSRDRGQSAQGAQRSGDSSSRDSFSRDRGQSAQGAQRSGDSFSRDSFSRDRGQSAQGAQRPGDSSSREREQRAHGAPRTKDGAQRERAAESAARYEGRRREHPGSTSAEQARDAQGIDPRKRRDERM